MSEPYIGVTGFMRRSEVERVLSIRTVRPIMVGVLVSDKTLRGESNKWPGRYPLVEKLKEIFIEHPRALNLLHLHVGQSEREKLFDYMLQAQNLAGVHCHGFQLNVPWPDPAVLDQYKHTGRGRKTIVLQIGKSALNQCDVFAGFIERLRIYDGLVQHVLYDQSGGYAVDFDQRQAAEFCRAVWSSSLPMGVGIAGGFTQHNVVSRIESLRKERVDPFFSIDAEGGLRTPPADTLDLEAAATYVSRADWAFSN